MGQIWIKALFICCIFLYTACKDCEKPSGGNSLKNIYIDLANLENEKPLDEYIDSVEFIPLETVDSSLIQMIGGVIIRDNKIYVRDEVQGCVFVFDGKGKFLFKIDRLGRGPDEYTHLLGFDVDQQNIIVLGLSELLLYDKNNGNFVKKIHIDPRDFLPVDLYVDSSFYYFQTADGFSDNRMQATILVFDKKDFSFRKGYVDPFYFKERPYVTSTVFIDSPHGVLFHQALNDTLYRLGENGLEPLYFLNVGKYQFTYEMYEQAHLGSDGKKHIPYKAIYPIDRIFFADGYLCFNCNQETRDPVKRNVFWCFYSLDTEKLVIFDENKLNEENKYFVNFLAFNVVDAEGYFYALCIPSILTYFRDVKKKALDERYGTMKAEDNPWLMKYRLKL